MYFARQSHKFAKDADRHLCVYPHNDSNAQASNLPVALRVCNLLYPWKHHEYPGRIRGFLSILDRHYTSKLMYHWFGGYKSPSLTCYVAMRETVYRMSLEVNSVLDALDRVILEKQKFKETYVPYFARVSEQTGKDSRGNWRK